jgi:hypothetical protein
MEKNQNQDQKFNVTEQEIDEVVETVVKEQEEEGLNSGCVNSGCHLV